MNLPKRRFHGRLINGEQHIWYVEDLWRLSQTLLPKQVDPKSIIDLDRDTWFQKEAVTPRLLLEHFKRILNADASYPVILHPDGSIMDGAHRTLQALLHDRPLISVVQFSEAPEPSCITRE